MDNGAIIVIRRKRVWYWGYYPNIINLKNKNQLINSRGNFSTVLRIFKPVDLQCKTISKHRT